MRWAREMWAHWRANRRARRILRDLEQIERLAGAVGLTRAPGERAEDFLDRIDYLLADGR